MEWRGVELVGGGTLTNIMLPPCLWEPVWGEGPSPTKTPRVLHTGVSGMFGVGHGLVGSFCVERGEHVQAVRERG